MNRIYLPATKPEDWKILLADPELHWKAGYSAMALAYCWQEADGFPRSVKKAFIDSGIDLFNDIEMLFGIPEHKVPLPGGAKPSQNDIFVMGKSDTNLIPIMVEGKVSEPFGPLTSEWFVNPSKGKIARLRFLCENLGVEIDQVQNIRYQLLHRTVSAIIEAKNYNTNHALMLVHTFSQANEWFDDYSVFLSLYDIAAEPDKIKYAGNIDGVNLYLGWVKGEGAYLNPKLDKRV